MEGFKKQAEKHLKRYIAGKNINFKSYCILHDKDAFDHQFVVWQNMLAEIEGRCKSIYDKTGGVKAQFKNMLRSEHISYNLFVPLKHNVDSKSVLNFFKKLLDRNDLKRISQFEIEWAPKEAKSALNDKTSFDTYVEFELDNQKKLGVGIEVKYTEKSYPYTKTEKERLDAQDDDSPYYKLWNSPVSVYKSDTYLTLGKKSFKQYFRNHLLGLSMIKNGLVNEFISMHLYPAGNIYQETSAVAYQQTIKMERQQTFKPMTFEQFLAVGSEVFEGSKEMEWLVYLQERYIVK